MSLAPSAGDIPRRQRLAFRLSVNVLVAALLIGLALSLGQIALDFSRVRASQDRIAQDILRAHQAAATLAAYNIDDQSAHGIVRGILEHSSIAQASLRSERVVLAQEAHANYRPESDGRDEAWLAPYASYRVALLVSDLKEPVGQLEIVVDQGEHFQSFLFRAALTLGTGLVYSLALALLLAWVVHLSITRHLTRLIGGLQAMDPERPQAELLSLPIEHERSELGLLTGKLHGLIASIARNIALREQAEQRLKDINEGLETEVQDRTRCLARANDSLLSALAELKSAQNQLMEAEKFAAIGQLSAGVAHEINNPIAFVAGNIGALRDYFQGLLRLIDSYENLEQALPQPDAAAEVRAVRKDIDLDFLREDAQLLLKECADGLSRVKAIVADLREYAGEENPQWQRCAIDGCLDNALKRLRAQLPSGVKLEQGFDDVPELECLPSQIEQMLEHLLHNAIQAVNGQGRITVDIRTQGEGMDIAVRDNGCGIPAEHQAHIFDPFYTTRPVGQGRGLGLSVVYNTVRRHGGRIRVESTPGKGSCFHVWLPLKQPAEPQAETLSFA
ncbi:MAG: hypothetical protein HYV16_11445 [Gammaproteobacteria bacterium]|nr:hypothetical protein [Gammaproteobacteria bacterium]